MVCIYCGSDTQVTNSRLNKKSNTVWRRRACTQCGNVISSYETVDLGKTWRVAQSRGLVGFSRDKLLLSVYKSCAHRPSAVADAGALTNTIITKISSQAGLGQISLFTIAEQTLSVLKRFDQAAATHYQAFHSAALASQPKR